MKAVRELRNLNHQMVENPIELSAAQNSDVNNVKDSTKKIIRKTSAKKKRGEEEIEGNYNEENIGDDEEDGKDEDEVSHYRDPPPGYIRLRPSIIPDLFPSTIYVEYPQELGIKRNDINLLEPIGDRKMLYKSYWERICIRNAFKRAGFEKSNTNKYWTALWSKHQNGDILQNLQCIQKVNHFPASWCVGRKDRLARTMNTMKRLHGKEFDYHPDTFIMPNDRDSFQRIFKTEQSAAATNSTTSTTSKKKPKESLWIVKPVASSCGRGISVHTISEAMKIASKKKVLVQRYLKNPYLINGKKFDLRIYILVSGVDPLRVYVHEEGLTRISTSDFSLKNISNRFAHLTNYSVQKKAENFKAASFDFEQSNTHPTPAAATEETEENTNTSSTNKPPSLTTEDPLFEMNHIPGETEGFKWSLSAFRRWLTAKEGKAKMEETFAKIYDICLKTMIAAEGEITPQLQSTVGYRTNCFELFGCDVILDETLTPHLLEVNVSPSLMGSSPLDKRIKGMLIADILHTVGMYPYDTTLMKKYSLEEEASVFTTSTNGIEHNNPFAFSNLTKLMANQDLYRKNACAASVDLRSLNTSSSSNTSHTTSTTTGTTSSTTTNTSTSGHNQPGNQYCNWWQMMLSVEDEIQRAKTGKFLLLHPKPKSASHYTALFRNPRFADHLLAKWMEEGGSRGRAYQYLPVSIQALLPKPMMARSLPSPRGGMSSGMMSGGGSSKSNMSGNMSQHMSGNMSNTKSGQTSTSTPIRPRSSSFSYTRPTSASTSYTTSSTTSSTTSNTASATTSSTAVRAQVTGNHIISSSTTTTTASTTTSTAMKAPSSNGVYILYPSHTSSGGGEEDTLGIAGGYQLQYHSPIPVTSTVDRLAYFPAEPSPPPIPVSIPVSIPVWIPTQTYQYSQHHIQHIQQHIQQSSPTKPPRARPRSASSTSSSSRLSQSQTNHQTQSQTHQIQHHQTYHQTYHQTPQQSQSQSQKVSQSQTQSQTYHETHHQPQQSHSQTYMSQPQTNVPHSQTHQSQSQTHMSQSQTPSLMAGLSMVSPTSSVSYKLSKVGEAAKAMLVDVLTAATLSPGPGHSPGHGQGFGQSFGHGSGQGSSPVHLIPSPPEAYAGHGEGSPKVGQICPKSGFPIPPPVELSPPHPSPPTAMSMSYSHPHNGHSPHRQHVQFLVTTKPTAAAEMSGSSSGSGGGGGNGGGGNGGTGIGKSGVTGVATGTGTGITVPVVFY